MEDLWLIKDKKHRILGPYTANEIISFIEEGRFKGQEMCSSYPSGQWTPISAHNRFYDCILKKMNEPSSAQNDKLETDIEESHPEENLEPTLIVKKPKKPKTKKHKQIKVHIPDSIRHKEKLEDQTDEESSQIIEMEDVQSQFIKNLFKALIIPVLVIASLSIAFFMILYPEKTKRIEQVHLMTIQKKKAALNEKEVQTKLRRALAYYLKDEVSLYVKSQFQLIQILESNPKHVLSYYHLCLVYLELWPFSYQDTQDKRALSDTLNRINKRDKGGIYSGLCNSVNALIDNKPKKALMIVNSSLDVLNKEGPIFFYYLKARAFKKLGKYNEARTYIQALYNLYPNWIAPYMLDAQMYYEKNNYVQAMGKYQEILKKYPKHIAANLRMGVLEYKYLKKISKSEKRLKTLVKDLSEIINSQILLESYQTLMEIYLKQRDKQTALLYAKKAYALNPADNDLMVLVTRLGNKKELENTEIKTRQLIYQGDILAGQGDCTQANKYYKKAYLSGDRRNALAAIRIAKCLWRSKVSGKAIQWLKKAIKADPKIVEAYFLLVDYLSLQYDFKNALDILEVARKQNPSSYEIYKAYALLAFRQKQYKMAISYSKRALKIYSSDVELYILLNKSYRAIQDYNNSYQYAKQAIEEDINSISAQISYALAIGSAYGFSRGEDYFRQLMKGFPLVMEYPQALGEYYFNDEKYKQALDMFSFVVQNYPNSKIAYMYLGRSYGMLGKQDNDVTKYRKAIQHLLKASLLDISDPAPLFYMGWIYMKNQQYVEAKRHYQKVLYLNSNYPLIHYYLGYINFLQGGDNNLNQALEFAKTEAHKNPRISLSYTLMGDIYKKKALSAADSVTERRKNYDLCAKAYQKAIRLQSKTIKFYVELIACYRGSGDFDSAVQIANKLIAGEGTSGYPEIYRQLGSIYEAKGEYKRALLVYKTYFSLKPAAPDRQRIQKRLKSYTLKAPSQNN